MNQQSKKAFTLVELIVVVTILAILGTIAFISLQGYSKSARDAKRISDISNIKTSLALFSTKTGRYPEPNDITNVVYSGATVWSQGVVGYQVTSNLSKNLTKKPLDPLLETEYTYSLLNTKKEYEVGCIFEGDLLSQNNSNLLNNTYAVENSYYAYIKGNYNGKVAKVSTGSIMYLFAVPSIIGADLGNQNIEKIIEDKSLVFNGYKNIPANYSSNNITMTGGFDFGGTDINPLVYSGSIEDLSTNYAALSSFGTNLQNAYSGTILSGNSEYQQLVEMDTIDATDLQQVAGTIVKDILGGEIAPETNCASKPNYNNISYTTGIPEEKNQARQNTNSSEACYFECNSSYTWTGEKCELSCQDGSTSPFLCADAYGSDRFEVVSGTYTDDKITGLRWHRAGTTSQTRNEQNSYCSNSGYRIPTAMELISLTDFNNNNGWSDRDYFTYTTNTYWSTTSGMSKRIQAGSSFRPVNPVNVTYRRCVYGTWLNTSGRYTDNGDGTISDSVTGLLIQQEGISQGTKQWNDAVSYCSTLDISGITGWRLPNIKELAAIVNHGITSPSIDTTYFNNTAGNSYWSSTVAANTSNAYRINFQQSTTSYSIGNDAKTAYRYVRCVK